MANPVLLQLAALALDQFANVSDPDQVSGSGTATPSRVRAWCWVQRGSNSARVGAWSRYCGGTAIRNPRSGMVLGQLVGIDLGLRE